MSNRIWLWLRQANNRDILKMSVAAIAAVVAAGWAVFTFVVDHDAPRGISASHGAVAAGRDASGNTVTASGAPEYRGKP